MNVKLQEFGIKPIQNKYPYCRQWLSDLLSSTVPFNIKINLMEQELANNCSVSDRSEPLVVDFKHPGILKKLFLKRDPLLLAEAYAKGWLHVEGDLERFIALSDLFSPTTIKSMPFQLLLEIFSWPDLNRPNLRGFPSFSAKHSLTRDKQSIQHHYDVGNEFYKLWLDDEMVYSCAHFSKAEMTLNQAQQAKLDLICRKLRLKQGETFLDIGCGWGGLLKWAARNYGVKAHGITLSQEQLEFNKKWIAESGLSDQVSVELCDYRTLEPSRRFDKIVSVGMIEHVGKKNYDAYFSVLIKALSPGGLLLNHGITTQTQWDPNGPAERFIDRYIFPDGELTRLSTTTDYMEKNGLEIVDVDCWRPHYAKTLRFWYNNLQQNYSQALALIGEEKMRLWELYLLGSALGFENNHLGICQIVARRRCDTRWTQPLSRAGWLC